MYQRIRSLWNCRCSYCTGVINAGTEIYWMRSRGAGHIECRNALQGGPNVRVVQEGPTESPFQINFRKKTDNPLSTFGRVKYFGHYKFGFSYRKSITNTRGIGYVRVIGIIARLVDSVNGEWWITEYCRKATGAEEAQALRDRERRIGEQKILTAAR